jgi:hypothetical protein
VSESAASFLNPGTSSVATALQMHAPEVASACPTVRVRPRQQDVKRAVLQQF